MIVPIYLLQEQIGGWTIGGIVFALLGAVLFFLAKAYEKSRDNKILVIETMASANRSLINCLQMEVRTNIELREAQIGKLRSETQDDINVLRHEYYEATLRVRDQMQEISIKLAELKALTIKEKR